MTKRQIVFIFLLVLVALLALPASVRPAEGQTPTKKIRQTRWEVVIDKIDFSQNRFRVTEIISYTSEIGPFGRNTHILDTARVDSLTAIKVQEDGRDVPENSPCVWELGRFCITAAPEQSRIHVINYFNPPLGNADSRSLRITYQVAGGLAAYPDGDRLVWPILPSWRTLPIEFASITVDWPVGVEILRSEVTPNGWNNRRDGNILRWEIGNVAVEGGKPHVLDLTFPHQTNLPTPIWQPRYEGRPFIESPIPTSSLPTFVLVLAAFVLIGVLVFVARRGR